MIVTKARDHGLVQLTRELAEWLMTRPRHGKPYGVKVYVDAKLEKSNRFDADGLYKDHDIVREKGLLQYWTPETCVFADTFDIVITVCPLKFTLIVAWWRWYSIVYLLAVSADSTAHHFIQLWLSWLPHQLQV
jgi:NAD+ kinase